MRVAASRAGIALALAALTLAVFVQVRHHEFVDYGHVIDDIAYFTEGFMDWLFAQKREN